MHFIFLSKSPSKWTPSRFPNRGPMERACLFTGHFYISLKIPYKNSPPPLNKEIFSLLSKALGIHVPQKWGPFGNRCLFSEPYLAYLSGSPVKEPSLRARCPVSRVLLHSFFKVPGIRAPFQVPQYRMEQHCDQESSYGRVLFFPSCYCLLHVVLHYFQSIFFRTRKVSIQIMFLLIPVMFHWM